MIAYKYVTTNAGYIHDHSEDLECLCDAEGLMEFVELMHDSEEYGEIKWAVVNGVITAEDNEGTKHEIIPVLEAK